MIRDFCIYLQSSGKHVLLLTNDVNFSNIAFLSGVQTMNLNTIKQRENFGFENLLNEFNNEKAFLFSETDSEIKRNISIEDAMSIDSSSETKPELLPTENVNFTNNAAVSSITKKLHLDHLFHSQDYVPKTILPTRSNLISSLETSLGNILKTSMIQCYGDIWMKIIKHKPPWNLKQIFNCYNKHWIAVFINLDSKIADCIKNLENIIYNESVSIAILNDEINQLFSYFEITEFKDLIEYPINNEVNEEGKSKSPELAIDYQISSALKSLISVTVCKVESLV